MSATYAEAYDYLCGLVKTVADANSWQVDWEDVPKKDAGVFPPTDPTVTWCRPRVRHVTGGQRTLGNVSGKRRFGRLGVMTVQVFTERGTGLSNAHANAKLLSDALEKAVPDSTGVWTRNTALNEIGPDGAYYLINVTTEFNYDEVK